MSGAIPEDFCREQVGLFNTFRQRVNVLRNSLTRCIFAAFLSAKCHNIFRPNATTKKQNNMKALIIIVCLAAWWALSIGGYFVFKKGAEKGLYKPEPRYNGDVKRWYKEALIASCCGFGLPLYLVYLLAKFSKK